MLLTITTILFLSLFFANSAQKAFASKPSEAERFAVFTKNEGLQQKLGLTDTQLEKLKKAMDASYFPHGRPGTGKPEELPSDEAFKQDEKFLAEVYEILTPEQKELFKVFKFQLNGGMEAGAVYVTKWEVLDLNKEQIEKLQSLEVERSGKYDALMKNIKTEGKSRKDAQAIFDKIREPFAEITKEYNVKMMDVLTPEQIEKGKKLTEKGKNLREEVGMPESDH